MWACRLFSLRISSLDQWFLGKSWCPGANPSHLAFSSSACWWCPSSCLQPNTMITVVSSTTHVPLKNLSSRWKNFFKQCSVLHGACVLVSYKLNLWCLGPYAVVIQSVVELTIKQIFMVVINCQGWHRKMKTVIFSYWKLVTSNRQFEPLKRHGETL